MQILKGDVTVIQDRTIYEDANIFAPNLHDMGLMTGRDFNNYISLFNSMTAYIQPPDLLIYLKAGIPTLVDHIQTRGREYEGSISIDYLKKLNERYENWISQYKLGRLLVISTDELDFVNKQEDLGTVIQSVRTQLHGLF
jgi:deoxyadenosine/deoxycytidine kinase